MFFCITEHILYPNYFIVKSMEHEQQIDDGEVPKDSAMNDNDLYRRYHGIYFKLYSCL